MFHKWGVFTSNPHMNIAQTTITTVTPSTSGQGSPNALVSYPKSHLLVLPPVTWSAVALKIRAQMATATKCDRNVIHIAMKSAKERRFRSLRPLDVLGGGRISASFLRSLHVKAVTKFMHASLKYADYG